MFILTTPGITAAALPHPTSSPPTKKFVPYLNIIFFSRAFRHPSSICKEDVRRTPSQLALRTHSACESEERRCVPHRIAVMFSYVFANSTNVLMLQRDGGKEEAGIAEKL